MRVLALLLTSLERKIIRQLQAQSLVQGDFCFSDYWQVKSVGWCLIVSLYLYSCTSVQGAKRQQKADKNSMFHAWDLNCRFTSSFCALNLSSTSITVSALSFFLMASQIGRTHASQTRRNTMFWFSPMCRRFRTGPQRLQSAVFIAITLKPILASW